jgi:NADH-quinone oxidoreductase subunit J
VELFFFYLCGGTALLGASLTVFHFRNPVYGAISLIVTMLALAGLFALLDAQFLAAIQVMVYAGAIMVLFLFVIMLLDLRQEEPRNTPIGGLLAPLFAAAVLGLVVPFFPDAEVKAAMNLTPIQGETASWGGQGLAVALFGRHMIVFEATSLLLLAGILGVVVLAKRRPRPGEDAPASDLGESGR